ncbi:MAG: hypothetical protein IPM74_11185 [Crocinitomicaceae bacterium]|nr:hypothetical protein [Crocinitomicaceae bacterium]MBK8926445.1 hypothetical protein [Crocinitomicaceae bacterium]
MGSEILFTIKTFIDVRSPSYLFIIVTFISFGSAGTKTDDKFNDENFMDLVYFDILHGV